MSTSSARPDDLDAFVTGSRAADDELRTLARRVAAAYAEFQAGSRWGYVDASSLIAGFGTYLDLNETDARWVAQIAAAFRAAGGHGDLSRLPDAAIEASLQAAGLAGGRTSVTFDDPVAFGFPPTSGYANDPVNTASGNFVIAQTDLPVGGLAAGMGWRRTYNSRSDVAGAFGPGWSSLADARLRARPEGAEYAGPDGQRAVFPRQGAGYGRVLGLAALVEPVGAGLALHWFDGRHWRFDSAGRPVHAEDGPGTAITFAWSGDRLTGLTHAGGRSVVLEWAGDRIIAAWASDGRRIEYAYAEGRLVRAGDDRYAVDDTGRVTAVVDADGVAEATNSYDAAGRVLTQESRFGRVTRFAYLPGGVTVTSGDEEDSPANTYVHDPHGRLLAVVDGHGRRLSRTYDEWGNPVTVTERNGAVSTAAWNRRGHPVRRILPDGVRVDYRYDDVGRVLDVHVSTGATVSYRYAGAERTPVEIVDAEGGVTRLEVHDGLVHRVIDPDGVTVAYSFDADGALRSATDALGNTARIERDAAGRVTAAITPLGRRTEFRYDGSGRLAERSDPAGGVWLYEYSPAGRITAVTDPAGARREIRYGSHGDAEVTVDPLGSATARRYDSLGNLTQILAADDAKWEFRHDARSRLTAATDPAGATWLSEYDEVGNLTGSTDPVGVHRTVTGDTGGRVTALADGVTGSTFEYDELGRPIAHIRPDGTTARAGYDRNGRRISIEDPAGGVTRIEYTPAGRIRRITSPGGRITTFERDSAGRLSARIDGVGRRVQFRYDADGAVIARERPGGAVETLRYDIAGWLVTREGTGHGPIRYAYDRAGRIIQITDAAEGTRRFIYDQAGRVIEAVDPLGGRTRYSYHARGWLIAVTDPVGAITTRDYDEVGRLVAETDPLGRVTRFAYDPAGRLISRVDGAGRQVRWTYDASGRVTTMGDISVVRDALGRPVEITEPGSFRHRLTWDRSGRLMSRSRDGLTLRFSYGPDGERTALGYPDGSETTYEYDGSGLMSALTYPATGRVTLTRDAGGRVIRAEGRGFRAGWEYADGGLAGYTYGDRTTRLTRDAAGRLSAVGDLALRYDAAGQLVGASDTTYEYDAAGRLVRDGAAAYAYDAAGQLLSQAGTTYEYDGSGRRTRARSADGTVRSYEWDGLGRLSAVDGTRVRVDALGELAEVGGSAVLWDGDPCWLGDGPVPPSWARLTSDWQGTLGEGRDVWGAPAREMAGLGFRGELEFGGVTWLRNRAYDPQTRAFLSPDPLQPVPGTAWSGNPYHYAGNDPVGRTDPLGLRPVSDAELRAYRDEMGQNAFGSAADWAGENWEYLAAGAMIVGGVALMFTGVGGPAGIALMAASGGLIAGGVSAGVQRFTTGEVDWGQVAVDGLIGAAGAGAGAGVTAALGSSARLAATNPFARELLLNGAESMVSGGVDRGLTGGDIFNPRALATDLVTGGAAPAPGGGLGPAEPEIPRYVFRGGSDTDINFTPRPVRDDSGLSTFDNPEAAFGDKGKKAQIVQIDLLGDDLRAVPDPPPPGHVSIRPADMNTMPEWQATRAGLEGGGTPHSLTDQVRAAVVGEVRRGPDGTLIWPEGWNP